MSETNDGVHITGGNVHIGNAAVGKNARATQYTTPYEQLISEPAPSPKYEPSKAPRIFLSHSSKDNAFSAQMAKDLYHALGNDAAAVWYDIENLKGGDTWWYRVTKELAERPIFIVILSPDALASGWVKDEIAMAWTQRNSPLGKLIIPVYHRECKVPADLAILQIVSFLPPKHYRAAFNELLQAIGVLTSS